MFSKLEPDDSLISKSDLLTQQLALKDNVFQLNTRKHEARSQLDTYTY